MTEEKKAWLKKEMEKEAGDAETTAAAIKALGGDAIPFFGDIANFDTAAAMVETCVKTFGKIDILVNVPGRSVSIRFGRFPKKPGTRSTIPSQRDISTPSAMRFLI